MATFRAVEAVAEPAQDLCRPGALMEAGRTRDILDMPGRAQPPVK